MKQTADTAPLFITNSALIELEMEVASDADALLHQNGVHIKVSTSTHLRTTVQTTQIKHGGRRTTAMPVNGEITVYHDDENKDTVS